MKTEDEEITFSQQKKTEQHQQEEEQEDNDCYDDDSLWRLPAAQRQLYLRIMKNEQRHVISDVTEREQEQQSDNKPTGLNTIF